MKEKKNKSAVDMAKRRWSLKTPEERKAFSVMMNKIKSDKQKEKNENISN